MTKSGIAFAFASLAFLGSLPTPVGAKVVQLREISWWALHGGQDENGQQICALVSSPPSLPEARFVFVYVKGEDRIFIRLVKPSWSIPSGTKTQIAVQFGYLPGRLIEVKGSGTELRGYLPGPDARAFLSNHSAGRIDVTFQSGNERPWELSTGGFGYLLPEFGKCIEMLQPAAGPRPPTQPF